MRRWQRIVLGAVAGTIASLGAMEVIKVLSGLGEPLVGKMLVCDLADMSLETLRGFSPLIEEDVFAVLTLEGSVAARDHVGGTAPNQVRRAIERVRGQLAE